MAGLITVGSSVSRPKKFGIPPVSALVRAVEVTFFRLAASFMSDQDRDDIADLCGALILEERSRPRAPERVRLVRRGLASWHRHRKRPPFRILGRVRGRRHRSDRARPPTDGQAYRTRPATPRSPTRRGARDLHCSSRRSKRAGAVGSAGGESGVIRTFPGPTTSANRNACEVRFCTRTFSPSAPASNATAWPLTVRPADGQLDLDRRTALHQGLAESGRRGATAAPRRPAGGVASR